MQGTDIIMVPWSILYWRLTENPDLLVAVWVFQPYEFKEQMENEAGAWSRALLIAFLIVYFPELNSFGSRAHPVLPSVTLITIAHLKQLGYVNKLDSWVPHKLNEIQLTKRISICDSLLKRKETDPFLKRYRKPIFIKRRLGWVFGGISKVLFILSCSQGIKLSIRMTTIAS